MKVLHVMLVLLVTAGAIQLGKLGGPDGEWCNKCPRQSSKTTCSSPGFKCNWCPIYGYSGDYENPEQERGGRCSFEPCGSDQAQKEKDMALAKYAKNACPTLGTEDECTADEALLLSTGLQPMWGQHPKCQWCSSETNVIKCMAKTEVLGDSQTEVLSDNLQCEEYERPDSVTNDKLKTSSLADLAEAFMDGVVTAKSSKFQFMCITNQNKGWKCPHINKEAEERKLSLDDFPSEAKCRGYSCTSNGQYCPEGLPGSDKGGYCCIKEKWVQQKGVGETTNCMA